MTSLFDADSFAARHETLEDGAMLLHGFAVREARLLLDDVARVAEAAPFRHLITPGGYTMSVAMTNCAGSVGYRTGGVTGTTRSIHKLECAGPRCPCRSSTLLYVLRPRRGSTYNPDDCLINRYVAGAKLSLHQDRDEKDPWAPMSPFRLACPPYFSGVGNAARTSAPSPAGKW